MVLLKGQYAQLTIKEKKCKSCKKPFFPVRSMQNVCNWKCAADLQTAKAKVKARKQSRKDLAEYRLKDRGIQTKKAQANFNKFIRLRDADQPCISCQRHHKGQYHAGHYRSVGSNPELRFNESNVHKQCSACNNHLSGNIADYRINLVKKIGIDEVNRLEGPHQSVKLTVDDIVTIKKLYAARCRELEGKVK